MVKNVFQSCLLHNGADTTSNIFRRFASKSWLHRTLIAAAHSMQDVLEHEWLMSGGPAVCMQSALHWANSSALPEDDDLVAILMKLLHNLFHFAVDEPPVSGAPCKVGPTIRHNQRTILQRQESVVPIAK
jgi:hypothetical protein